MKISVCSVNFNTISLNPNPTPTHTPTPTRLPMAVTAKLLHLRPTRRTISNPSLIRFFSDEPNSNPTTTTTSSDDAASSTSQSSLSSFLGGVKASLRQQPSPPPPPGGRPFNPSFFPSRNNQTPRARIASLEEIQRNLSEFRRRSAAPIPSPPSSGEGRPPSGQPVSFEEVYKRNVLFKGQESPPPSGRKGFQAIKESLMNLKPSALNNNQPRGDARKGDLPSLMNSLQRKPGSEQSPPAMDGRDKLPTSVFRKELNDKKDDDQDKEVMKTEFLRNYGYDELGEKLRMLRPEKKGEKNWFTLEELSERLAKLREYEQKENNVGGVYSDLRSVLYKLNKIDDHKNKNTMMQRIDFIGQIGGTPSYMLSPPKEHLVETYFHPDNMSSAEKLKLELKKVRDEFKMSESDCGSARVQIAQLTTKIKHLSSVLHKKDKHSRKGLLAMVQQRKKLLKYLRRTDWDSYCFVLSKLGLRDNPELKF